MDESVNVRIGPVNVKIIADYEHMWRLKYFLSNFIVDNVPDLTLQILTEDMMYEQPEKISFSTIINSASMDSKGKHMRASYNFEKNLCRAYFPPRSENIMKNKLILDGIYNYMHLFFAYILFERGCLLIHGSCVSSQGKGHLFAGESGSGKSTIAGKAHSEGFDVLGDESICVDVANKTLHSTFFKKNFEPKSAELVSCSFIFKSSSFEKMKISEYDASKFLLGKSHLFIYLWPEIPIQILRRITTMCVELVKKVPMYTLKSRLEDEIKVMLK